MQGVPAGCRSRRRDLLRRCYSPLPTIQIMGICLGEIWDKGDGEKGNREDDPLEVSHNQLHFRPLGCLCPPRRGLGSAGRGRPPAGVVLSNLWAPATPRT